MALAILVGAVRPLVSLPLAAILLVAAITVHLPFGFSSIKLPEVTAAGPHSAPLDHDQIPPPGGTCHSRARRIRALRASTRLRANETVARDRMSGARDADPCRFVFFEAHLSVADLDRSIAFYRDRLGL